MTTTIGQVAEQIELFKVATIAKRSVEDAELTDTTCTPSWLTEALPEVDLDPYSNLRSHVCSVKAFCVERGEDGHTEPWLSEDLQPCTAFQNHPFSDPKEFVEKAHYEMKIGRCVDLIVLCKDDPSTEWHEVLTTWYPDAPRGHVLSLPPELWRFPFRIQYDEHPDVIEARRLKRIAKAVREGKPEKYIAKIHGRSTANFCSVIYHFRGWIFEEWLANGASLGKHLRRRAKLDLEKFGAVRWVQQP